MLKGFFALLFFIPSLGFAAECKTWISDESRFAKKVLIPKLTEDQWSPTPTLATTQTDFIKSVQENDLVFQISYRHHQAWTSPVTHYDDCEIGVMLSRVVKNTDGRIQFEPIRTTIRSNEKPHRKVSTQIEACKYAMDEILKVLESCESYRDKTNQERMLFNQAEDTLTWNYGYLSTETWDDNFERWTDWLQKKN